jgi:omega-amidase
MSSQPFRVSLLQMDLELGEPDRNFEKLANLLEQTVQAEHKPDVIMFPEMWNTGYALDRIHDLADPNGERTKEFVARFCRAHGVNVIAGSIAEKKGTEVKNTIYVFDRNGDVTEEYSKIHLFRLMDEEKFLAAGQRVGRTKIDGIEAGMMICYDLRFPELARKLALEGAEILFVPAEWPKPRLNHWRTLLTARAIENQMYVVACNRIGFGGQTEFFGHSMVVDPWGEIIAEADEQETILNVEIDLSNVDKVRRTIPIFEDRRPHLY